MAALVLVSLLLLLAESLPPLPRNMEGVEDDEAAGGEDEGVEVEEEVEVVVPRVLSRCSSRKIRISRRRFKTISSTNLASSVDESRFNAICATRAISSLFDFI